MKEYSEDDDVTEVFQKGNADFVFSPCVDDLIDRFWSIV